MAKKKKKGKAGKVAGGVGVAAVIAALALFGGKGLGLGNGSGLGLGVGNDTKVNSETQNQTDEEKEPVEEKQDETVAGKVSVEVKEGQYLIDGTEKSLADIEALLTAEDAKNTSFTLVNNYASAKAWDEVKALFTKYGIAVTEQ